MSLGSTIHRYSDMPADMQFKSTQNIESHVVDPDRGAHLETLPGLGHLSVNYGHQDAKLSRRDAECEAAQ